MRHDGYCGNCDKGRIVDEETREVRWCECRPRAIALNRQRGCIPRRHAGLGGFEASQFQGLPRPMQKLFRGYVTEIADNVASGRGLWLCGPNGTGKTTAAAVIMNELMRSMNAIGDGSDRHYVTGRMLTANQLLNTLRETYNPENSRDYLNQVKYFEREVDVLVIDDIGAARPTDWAVSEGFFDVLNGRVDWGLPLIVTSDVTPRELDDTLGKRLVDRLEGMTGAPVLFGGLSWRKHHAYGTEGDDGVRRLPIDAQNLDGQDKAA